MIEAIASDDHERVRSLIDASSLTRKCGQCTGCCTALSVPEIGKNNGETCKHEVKRRGCGIYQNRPAQCRNFYCFWKLGIGSRKDSPHLTGVVIDSYEHEGKIILRCAEVWNGAADEGKPGWLFLMSISSFADTILIMKKDGTQRILYRKVDRLVTRSQ
jgi:hypothetical protein